MLLKYAIKSASENLNTIILCCGYNNHFLFCHMWVFRSLSFMETLSISWGARSVIKDRSTEFSARWHHSTSFHCQVSFILSVCLCTCRCAHMGVWMKLHVYVYAGKTTSLLPFSKQQPPSLVLEHEHHFKCGF